MYKGKRVNSQGFKGKIEYDEKRIQGRGIPGEIWISSLPTLWRDESQREREDQREPDVQSVYM